MLTRAEAERIAASGNALRPDWSVEQILAVLGDTRIRNGRAYLDTAVALTRIACDPNTRQPTRLLEAGPWWATNPAERNTSAAIRRPASDDCEVCSRSKLELHLDHDYAPRNSAGYGSSMPDDVRTRLAEVAEAAHLVETAEREAADPTPPRPASDVLADDQEAKP